MAGTVWLMRRPPGDIALDSVFLARTALADNDALVRAVNASLDHLRPWMPWAQEPATPESLGAFLARADEGWENGTDFSYTVRLAPTGPIVGGCGLHARIGPGALEIGYWVHVDHVRKGLATAAARALTAAALGLGPVGRVEIHCDAANVASAAVPARLGYRLDRTEYKEPAAPGETGQHMVWVTEGRPG